MHCAQKLLQSENLSYKVKPVASYDDLLRARQSIAQDEVCLTSAIPAVVKIICGKKSMPQSFARRSLDCTFSERCPPRHTHLCHVSDSTLRVQISSIIMINCGGTIDIVDFLQPPPDATIYILDSHRPYHLNNVREHIQQVCRAGALQDISSLLSCQFKTANEMFANFCTLLTFLQLI